MDQGEVSEALMRSAAFKRMAKNSVAKINIILMAVLKKNKTNAKNATMNKISVFETKAGSDPAFARFTLLASASPWPCHQTEVAVTILNVARISLFEEYKTKLPVTFIKCTEVTAHVIRI